MPQADPPRPLPVSDAPATFSFQNVSPVATMESPYRPAPLPRFASGAGPSEAGNRHPGQVRYSLSRPQEVRDERAGVWASTSSETSHGAIVFDARGSFLGVANSIRASSDELPRIHAMDSWRRGLFPAASG